METKEFLRTICNEASVSGYETNVTKIIEKEFSEYCDTVSVDKIGNVIGVKKGYGKKKIMLAAHMDEIGLMVSAIEKDGFVRFVSIGGYDQRTLIAQEVIIHGRQKVFGVIGMKPPHLNTAEDKDKAIKLKDMLIDTGYSEDELKKYIRIGDVVTIKREMIDLLNDTFSAKALDDRAGIASLYECMKELKYVNVDATIYYVATVQEEVGVRGAKVSSYAVNPDIAIAVDVGFAKTPELKDYDTILFGEGPAIGIGPNMHPKVVDLLTNAGDKYGVKYQVEVIPGMSGTDANAMQIVREGVRTGVLSIPLKYMHTSVETMCMKDIFATGRLLSSMIISLNDKDLEDELCY